MDVSLFQLEGYNLISQGYICSTHGGLAMYLRDSFNYKTLDIYNKSDIWEGKFIEISSNLLQKNIILGNIYRPPRDITDNYNLFISQLTPVLDLLNRKNSHVVIAGDFNIDLLKINERDIVNTYFDTITSLSFFPQITLPTRLSQNRGTLIDNFLLKLTNFKHSPTTGILMSNISDHFPYFISLDCGKIFESNPKYTYIRQNTSESYNNFQKEISTSNIFDKMNKNPNTNPTENYNLLENICKHAFENNFPTKKVKFNKYKHKKSSWITRGILISMANRDKLYKEPKRLPLTQRNMISAKPIYTHIIIFLRIILNNFL